MAKIRIPSSVKLILKAGVTIAALWFVFSKIPFREVLETASRMDPLYILFAIIAFALSKGIAAKRLHIFLLRTGVTISQKFNLKLYLLGMFYNLFLPGGIGGDGYKIFLLSKKSPVKGSKIFWTIVVDRLSGIFGLFLLAIPIYYFTPLDAGFLQGLIWISAPAGIAVSWFILKKFLPGLSPVFGSTSLLSIAVQFSQLVSASLILLALGYDHQHISYLFLFLVSSIVAMLPVTIGGVGSREFTFLLGSEMLGLDSSLGITLSLVFYLITVLVSFFGIIFIVKPGELRVRSNSIQQQ